MTEELPLWLFIPSAILLYGYLIADAIVRRANRRRATNHTDGSQ